MIRRLFIFQIILLGGLSLIFALPRTPPIKDAALNTDLPNYLTLSGYSGKKFGVPSEDERAILADDTGFFRRDYHREITKEQLATPIIEEVVGIDRHVRRALRSLMDTRRPPLWGAHVPAPLHRAPGNSTRRNHSTLNWSSRRMHTRYRCESGTGCKCAGGRLEVGPRGIAPSDFAGEGRAGVACGDDAAGGGV